MIIITLLPVQHSSSAIDTATCLKQVLYELQGVLSVFYGLGNPRRLCFRRKQ